MNSKPARFCFLVSDDNVRGEASPPSYLSSVRSTSSLVPFCIVVGCSDKFTNHRGNLPSPIAGVYRAASFGFQRWMIGISYRAYSGSVIVIWGQVHNTIRPACSDRCSLRINDQPLTCQNERNGREVTYTGFRDDILWLIGTMHVEEAWIVMWKLKLRVLEPLKVGLT